jgi:hypothetical protein
MDIQNDLTVVKADAEKIAADARRAEETAVLADSWLKTNWQYAVAIAVGASVLGLALGLRIGEHMAHVA